MIINNSDDYQKAVYDFYRQIDEDSKKETDMENLKFIKTREVKSPCRAHSTDAGIDFFIPNDFEKVVLKPGEDTCIPSGIKVLVPHGYALIFKEKSGVALKKKLTVGACVVDEPYRGEVHLHLFNNGTFEQTLEPGDKIVQGLVIPVSYCDIQEITEEEYNKDETDRGEGGFGSSGVK